MAFVNRSPKPSLFKDNSSLSPATNCDSLICEDTQQRIHCQRQQNGHSKRAKVIKQGSNVNHKRIAVQTQGQLQSLLIETAKQGTWSSRKFGQKQISGQQKMRKRKCHKKQDNERDRKSDRQTNQIKQKWYDVPGAFDACKTIVKYPTRKNQQERKTEQAQRQTARISDTMAPGPGQYHTEAPRTAIGGKINPLESTSAAFMRAANEGISEYENKESLFPVKYDRMNSSFFKRPSNLLGFSNRQLLSKLFKGKESTRYQSLANTEDKEYLQVQDYSPGPASYHIQHSQLAKNSSSTGSPFISGSSRFMKSSQALAAPTSYNVNHDEKYEYSEGASSMFASKAVRFLPDNPMNHRVQYGTTENSLLKQSKSSSWLKIPFNSTVQRADPVKQDNRSFHHPKIPFINPPQGHWSQSLVERSIFQVDNENPGPGAYLKLATNNNINNSSKSLKALRFNKHHSPAKRQKQNLPIQVGLISPHKLNQHFTRQKGDKLYRRSHLKLYIEGRDNYLDKVYEVPAIWQKRSYNINFTKDILHPNNPTQNCI